MMVQKKSVATKIENHKHLLLVILVSAVVFIGVFIASTARASEPRPIIVADFFGDLQQKLEKSARDAINSGGTRREEHPATNQPVPSSQYPAQTAQPSPQTTTAKKKAKQSGATNMGSLTDEWIGTWGSHDVNGKKSLAVSSSKLVSTFMVKYDDGKPTKVTVVHRWSNVNREEDVRDEETFGLHKKRTTPAEISKDYEISLKQYKKDPTDFAVSDPKASRKAILAMTPGVYQVMWRYSGGDCGYSEYIVDNDRMLEISTCKYYHGISQYNRSQ